MKETLYFAATIRYNRVSYPINEEESFMKLSVFAVCLADRPLKDALAYLKEKAFRL